MDSSNKTLDTNRSISQWSFRKTGTMGTLASQAEIGVWVQAPGHLAGILLKEKF